VIYAIDPGPEKSALVLMEGQTIGGCLTESNDEIRQMLLHRPRQKSDVLVLEQIASFGMPVGAEVFETVFWSGRFVEVWGMPSWHRVKRHEVKVHLCGSMRAKDANIRQALIDRFGPGKATACGTKDKPGPLYGMHGDEWQALAAGVTWADKVRV
jgi:hypothetical protein